MEGRQDAAAGQDFVESLGEVIGEWLVEGGESLVDEAVDAALLAVGEVGLGLGLLVGFLDFEAALEMAAAESAGGPLAVLAGSVVGAVEEAVEEIVESADARAAVALGEAAEEAKLRLAAESSGEEVDGRAVGEDHDEEGAEHDDGVAMVSSPATLAIAGQEEGPGGLKVEEGEGGEALGAEGQEALSDVGVLEEGGQVRKQVTGVGGGGRVHGGSRPGCYPGWGWWSKGNPIALEVPSITFSNAGQAPPGTSWFPGVGESDHAQRRA